MSAKLLPAKKNEGSFVSVFHVFIYNSNGVTDSSIFPSSVKLRRPYISFSHEKALTIIQNCNFRTLIRSIVFPNEDFLENFSCAFETLLQHWEIPAIDIEAFNFHCKHCIRYFSSSFEIC